MQSEVKPYLDPLIADKVQDFFQDMQDEGINIQMSSAFRTTDGQALYTGNDLGGATAGNSLHEAGLAIDISRVQWDLLSPDAQARIVSLAEDNGLSWGGPRSPTDPIHFEVDPFGGSTGATLQARQQYIVMQQALWRMWTMEGAVK